MNIGKEYKSREIKKSKVATILILILIMLSLMVGCGSKDNSGVNNQPGNASAAESGNDSSSNSSGSDGAAIWKYDGGKTVYPKKRTETVTATADAKGNIEKITSTVILSEISGEDVIMDYCNLSDIKNKAGDEEFDNQGNMVYWQNKGSKIEYEGTGKSDIPVELNITYKLNDEEIEPEKLVGKSGKITIRIDYNNKIKDDISVDERNYSMNVPLIAATAMFFPEGVLSNVEVENGKLTSVGSQDVIIGAAFPGLKDSINGNNDKNNGNNSSGSEENEIVKDIDFAEFIEIKADATDFEMDFSTTIIQNGMLKDMEKSDKIDDLDESMKDLKEATDKLVDGADSLLEGQMKATDGIREYVEGVRTLDSGLLALMDGANALEAQNQALVDGANGVSAGLNGLSSFVSQMGGMIPTSMSEAERMQFMGMIAELQNQVDALAEGGSQLAAGVQGYTSGVTQVSQGVTQLRDGSYQLASQNVNLVEGLYMLEDGTSEFGDGLAKFRDEGISELVDFVEGDLVDLSRRLDGLKGIDSKYNTYSGGEKIENVAPETIESNVMYIIETKEIKK